MADPAPAPVSAAAAAETKNWRRSSLVPVVSRSVSSARSPRRAFSLDKTHPSRNRTQDELIPPQFSLDLSGLQYDSLVISHSLEGFCEPCVDNKIRSNCKDKNRTRGTPTGLPGRPRIDHAHDTMLIPRHTVAACPQDSQTATGRSVEFATCLAGDPECRRWIALVPQVLCHWFDEKKLG